MPDKVKIILLTRDGRGVFYSHLKRNFPKKESLNTWKHHYNRALSLFKDNVDEKSIIHVKYETIAISPRDELKRICNFLGHRFRGRDA